MRPVGMLDDCGLMPRHAERVQGLQRGLAHMGCVRLVSLMPVEGEGVDRILSRSA